MKRKLFSLVKGLMLMGITGCAAVSPNISEKEDIQLNNSEKVKIQLIRNATMKISYAGKTFLTDPMFSEKGTIVSFAGKEKNPTVEMTVKMDDILNGIDGILTTHTHPDHFDKFASNILPKQIPIFCQPVDKKRMEEDGFKNINSIERSIIWEGITITRTGGKHGSGEILKYMGEASGYVLQAKDEPTIYWIGDVVLGEEVGNVIKTFKPDIIITHSGGAIKSGFENDPILMNAEQTIKVAQMAPNAKIVAIHMEALDHCTVTREGLRQIADNVGIKVERLIIPKDGEKISL